MATSNINRPTAKDRASKAILGINKHLASVASVTLGGVAYKPADLTTQLQAFITSANAVDSARATWLKMVQDGLASKTQTIGLLRALKSYLLVNYGSEAVDLLGDFGFSPPKPTGTVPVKVKAAAVDKTLATRAARHTMGAVQRLPLRRGTRDIRPKFGLQAASAASL
jgi:hypothetical protein